ncbi:MAG: glycerophosphodiester phosphodiesterase [Solirubrobacteraceae bacterium]
MSFEATVRSRKPSRPRRVGHKGAAEIAPGNTLAAFDAALATGVDMIEFDVLSERRDGMGELFVAHDYEALRNGERLTLDEVIAHLSSSAFAQIELDVDLKLPGYGVRVAAALRDAGLLERCLLSSTFPADLDLLRASFPNARTGWSVPRARHDYTSHPATLLPALGLLLALRAWLPGRAHAALRSGRFDAIMAHRRLVSTALVSAVRRGGGELYVWTVDDAREIERLTALGVDGIISNDPRLFGALEADLSAIRRCTSRR